MAGRRGLSTSSSRPRTSGNRPGTAGDYYSQDTGYAYSNEYSFDEEEESEEEDVFAFVRPTTADQHPDQSILQSSPHHVQDPSPSHVHVAFPTPTYDPRGRYAADSPSVPDPSNLTGVLALHHAHNRPSPPPPVDTPPSTDSQCTDDPYRLRRVVTASTSAHEESPGAGSKGDARQRHFPLSTASERIQEELSYDFSGKEHAASTLNTSPSILDDESQAESIKMGFDFDALHDEDSPFPEVRASVSNMDDPEMPAMTIRMWIIGLFLCMISSAMNLYFNFRQPAPTVVPLALVIVSYPLGKSFAFVLPITTYRLPRWLGGTEFSLNPGPWNIKEHALIFIMANVAIGSPYALNATVVAEVYYKVKAQFWFDLTLVLATQMTGFGLAGLCRRFLVWPASMVWPQNLVVCTLLNTLHAEEDEESNGVSRYTFFMWVCGGVFVFYFLPGFLFTALSVFSWVCWIAPNNVPINQLFGVYSGLGMGIVTFDWAQVSWIGSPLMVPWWAEVQIFAGFVGFFWILAPILYYTDAWHLSHFPISDYQPYDKYGNPYNITRVLTPQDTFDLEAFENYSPLYLPATYTITYLLAFALSTCVIVHTLLYHGATLLNGVKKMKIEKDDIHAKLMRNYPEVPDWWYGISFVLFFALAVVAVEVWHRGVPIWALLLSVLIPIMYVLPGGFIFAMTGQGITVNLIAQIIPGQLLPGNPIANMVFKAYSVQTLTEATSFVQDLKLGHYVKVPPRSTFTVQLVATIMAAFVQVGVKHWMFSIIPDICSPDQKSDLKCPHNQVFFTASAIWGLIGPSRQFGTGSIYHPEVYALVVGAVLPFPFWILQKYYPKPWMQCINTPVILNGVGYIPPATGINYSSWFAAGFVFQYLIRRKNFLWWSKFNYLASAALDSGTAISLIFIFLTLQFPKGGRISLNWWGNNVWMNTADYNLIPLRTGPVLS